MSEFPNIRHMRVFLETARSGSVSVAADRCALSQPAATQAIKRLESGFDAELLVRRAGSFALTRCGTLFAARVEAALDHLHAGARAAVRGAEKGRAPFDRLVTAAVAPIDFDKVVIATARIGERTRQRDGLSFVD